MPVHEIDMSVPPKVVLNSDVVFEIRSDGEKLGELRVSRGTVDWVPANRHTPIRVEWEQFDQMMRGRA